jgi:hypothetical protein
VLDSCFHELGTRVHQRATATPPFMSRLDGFVRAHGEFSILCPDAAELIVRTALLQRDLSASGQPARYQPLRELATDIFTRALERGELTLRGKMQPEQAAECLLGSQRC